MEQKRPSNLTPQKQPSNTNSVFLTNKENKLLQSPSQLPASDGSCFSENYLVFSLKRIDAPPQDTYRYLDRENDVLDYSQNANFQRNQKRLEHATGAFDQGAQDVGTIADEIDGDDRLGVTRRTGMLFNTKLVSNGAATKPNFNLNESMFIETAASYDELQQQLAQKEEVAKPAKSVGDSTGITTSSCRHRRYSIIGNDPTFKQYTKNHDYDAIKFTEQRKDKARMQQNVLTVSLKDLATIPQESSTMSQNAMPGFDADGFMGGEDEKQQPIREQYRVLKKDLLFKVNFQQSNRKYAHGENVVVTERTLSDFRKLGKSLQRLFPGCFVPIIPKEKATIDLPQSIFDFRKTPMECAQVENFCRKLRNIQYLLDSDAVQLFMDPRIFQVQLDSQMVNLVKQTATPSDTLVRFKNSFNQLSHMQVDQNTFDKIEKFRSFNLEIQKQLIRFKSICERAMTNKVDYDNAKEKLFESMGDIEDFLAHEVGDNRFIMRAEQRVLDKHREVNNDTHWRALEAIDDFIRDQLADCEALTECFTVMFKAQQRMNMAKDALDNKTQNVISKEKRHQVPKEKINRARVELDQTEMGFYEANLSYNLMIVCMAYGTIDQFKVEKLKSFQHIIHTLCQARIVQENEMHGFFKFVLNFYRTDF